MCIEIGLGTGRTHADVGAHGVPLDSWKQGTSGAVHTGADQPTA
jgi:hypothetical protein